MPDCDVCISEMAFRGVMSSLDPYRPTCSLRLHWDL